MTTLREKLGREARGHAKYLKHNLSPPNAMPEGFFHNRKVCKMCNDFYFFTLIGWIAAGFFLGIIVGATCT